MRLCCECFHVEPSILVPRFVVLVIEYLISESRIRISKLNFELVMSIWPAVSFVKRAGLETRYVFFIFDFLL